MKRRAILLLLHLNFVTGLVYAGIHVFLTPRLELLQRRLWAYEYWIIFGFYALFLVVSRMEKLLLTHRPEKVHK